MITALTEKAADGALLTPSVRLFAASLTIFSPHASSAAVFVAPSVASITTWLAAFAGTPVTVNVCWLSLQPVVGMLMGTDVIVQLGPCGPVGPVGPATVEGAPAGPVGPVAPVAPVGPVGPVGPVSPVLPVSPLAPGLPSAPAGPVGPVGPVGPCSP